MTKDFQSFLTRFVDAYGGNKLFFVMAGGGGSAALLSVIPGSSKVLHEVRVLYSEESSLEYYKESNDSWGSTENPKFVSEQMMDGLYQTAANVYENKYVVVAATSALTSSRYRRGDNKAYIRVFGSGWELKFDKLPEHVYEDTCTPWRDQKIANKRQAEDELLVSVAIKLATNFERDTLDELVSNGSLKRLP